MPVHHDRPQSGYFDAHPPRDAYRPEVTAAELGEVLADDQMTKYQEGCERARTGDTSRAESWAYVIAGAAVLGVLLGLLTR
ncbi:MULTISPECIES: hypothetical protein [unclassified Kitasatospora]|uniref:hypothetical protein n=1 Tax=unclassified Kitasatospora TaxID=2633591 RepID=UPI000711114F|nr:MULTISPECIES: hypothetical protein [unclassified Kitasatospora]KQV12424.1 hypothetical protein ASC99_34620 [Kitasatospora sp. Root107]KRB66925.1 hypothetical protein ASE03_30660 [Kitasatospora sp. Root187]